MHCPLNNAPKTSASHGRDVSLNKKEEQKEELITLTFLPRLLTQGNLQEMQEGKKRGNFRLCCNIGREGRGLWRRRKRRRWQGCLSLEWNLSNIHTHKHAFAHSPLLIGKRVGEAENALIKIDAWGTSQVEQRYASVTRASCFTPADCYASYGQLIILNYSETKKKLMLNFHCPSSAFQKAHWYSKGKDSHVS